MPRHTPSPPLLTTLHQQAAKALALLNQQIAQREQELIRLQAEAARWQSIMGGQSQRVRTAAVPRQARKPQRRVDWNAVLAGRPRTFTAREVTTKAGKPLAQVYTHVSHWRKDKKVRTVAGGSQQVAPPSQSLSPTRSDKPR